MFPLRFKKLDERAVIPKYESKKASGFDLVLIEDVQIPIGCTVVGKTGLACALPANTEMQIRPRSGLSLKTSLRIANSPATIDEDYRGEIGILMTNVTPNPHSILQFKAGTRAAQGVICPVIRPEIIVVDELDETERGTGKFGSTGLEVENNG